MHLQILSPDRLLFSGKVDFVQIPTSIWEIGILPNHAPLTTIVSSGSIKFIAREKEERILDETSFLFEDEYTILHVGEWMVYLDEEEISIFVRFWASELQSNSVMNAFETAHLEIKNLQKQYKIHKIE